MINNQQSRHNLWYALAILLVIAIVMAIMPFTYFWIIIFDILRLHFWWPVFLPLAGFALWRMANKQFQLSGQPQYFPHLTWFLFIFFIALLLFWIDATADQWSRQWFWLILPFLSFGIGAVIVLLFAHAELWRQLANRAVNKEVIRRIKNGRFQKQIDSDPEQWGSLHQLFSVRQQYLKDQKNIYDYFHNDTYPEYITAYLEIAHTLLNYIGVRWAQSVLPAAIVDWWRTELLREIITLYLLKKHLLEEQDILIWDEKIQYCIDELGKIQKPYPQMLAHIFHLGQSNHSPINIGLTVRETLTKFAQLPTTSQAPDDTTANIREICAHTWAALAHNSIYGQACFDVWIAMQETEETIFIVNANGVFPASLAARDFVANWYAQWSDQINEQWNQGLKGRATYVRELAKS